MRFGSTLSVLVLLVLSGCNSARLHVEPSDLFWPLPPEKPRVHYIGSVYSEDDLGYEYSIRERLFGKGYPDSLSRPYGVTAKNNRIYIADIGSMRVFVYDKNIKKMMIVGKEGAVRVPSSVVADSSGNMYVADAAQSKIAVYKPDGQYHTAYLLDAAKPVALALNESLGRIYVVDRNKYRVIVLSMSGKRLFEFGGKGLDDGFMNIPLSIAIDRNGLVYVLDSGNFRVQTFDPDGKFLRKFGSVGDRPGLFANPKGVAVDSDGHVYVTDAAFNNFQIFDIDGSILLYVGHMGSDPGDLYVPGSIFIDEQDRIYVADQFNSRISIFQYFPLH